MDDSVYAIEPSGNDIYGLGSLISPILPFAKANQMDLKFKANLIGVKIVNPTIHICDKCTLPILIYGRMVIIFITIAYLFSLTLF